MMFAKLFDRPEYGQVLLMLGADEKNAPGIRWYARPPGLGVSSFALGFVDSDEGLDAAERAFKRAGDAEADTAAEALFSAAGEALEAQAASD